MVRFADGRLRNDNAWFAYHLGGDTAYSRKFPETFGPPCPNEDHVDDEPYKDVAASGQQTLERVLLDIAAWTQPQTRESALCLAGGVALNAVANGRLVEQDLP